MRYHCVTTAVPMLNTGWSLFPHVGGKKQPRQKTPTNQIKLRKINFWRTRKDARKGRKSAPKHGAAVLWELFES